jgi:ferredoxin
MSVEMQEMVHFHLTGKRGDGAIETVIPQDIRPALLAPYHQLQKLRYDFPLILLDDDNSQAFIDTLSGVVNRLLREIAPEGNAGEQLRQHVIRLECRMRELVSNGFDSPLDALWAKAEKSLLNERSKSRAEALENSLETARFALSIKGKVVDCDERLPTRVLRHAWAKVEAQRTRRSLDQIDTLIIRLRNILKVDDLKTGRSRTPQKIKQTLGRRYKDAFDFEMMSEILHDATPHNRLPIDRRRRVRAALSVLESQKFFARNDGGKHTLYDFVFTSASGALQAYNKRLPEIANVVKAIAIAELECENAYRAQNHTAYFDRFGVQALGPDDLALFPSYLICLQESECDTRDKAELMEIASSDLPMKVLLQVSDILGEPSPVDGQLHHGAFVQQFANTFVALGNAYVLQAASSGLYQQREQIRRGMEYRGPAIFSVFAANAATASNLPAYLMAAAAMESRIFPAFSYDPAAGPGLAERFSIQNNPEIEAAWPRRELRYEDEDLQTISEQQAFTLVDFAVTDSRYGDYFALAPRESWTEDMLPVANYLDLADEDTFEKVPYVPVIDDSNILQRLIVDDSLIRVARRCRDRWHVLQEHGGIHNSYASALMSKERAAWESEKEKEIQTIRAEFARTDQSQPAVAVAVAPQPEPEDAEESPVLADQAATVISDDPFIDTPSCTTCDECTNKNNRMFAYDDNKQAYIQDPDAGTYRELVEAAEVCQVAIIHPGKPRNQSEPGLEELIKRAEPFMA